MNKQELIKRITEKADFKRAVSKQALEIVIEVITEALAEGETIQLSGFGKFEVRDRAERTGTNPSTGEDIIIPAGKTPVFRAGKTLKDAIN